MQSYIRENTVKFDFVNIEETALKIFDIFNIKITNLSFCTIKNEKWKPKFLRYTEKNNAKLITAASTDDYVQGIDFYSLNTSDFEPNSKLIVSILFENNCINRISCVIDLSLFPPVFFQKYIETANILITQWHALSGYAFIFPNSFFPFSFSQSIFRRLCNPPEYDYIAQKIEKKDWEDNKELIFMGNYNFLYFTDNELRDRVISDLRPEDEYCVQDDFLFWKISCKDDDITKLIHSEQYKKTADVLTENGLLNDMTFVNYQGKFQRAMYERSKSEKTEESS